MSFVTFVRDYIQDPDKIVHIPSFIFDACREFFWYIISFQWLRNLTYVTLSLAYPEGLSSDSGTFYSMQNNGISQPYSPSGLAGPAGIPSTSLSTMVGDFLASSGLPISIPNIGETAAKLSTSSASFGESMGNEMKTALESNVIAPFLLRTQDGFSFLHSLQEKSTLTESSFGLVQNAYSSLLTNSTYGFFNGIISNFHFCAITIVIAHILLNENKNRAFKMGLISCLGDLSCMVAVLLGFRRLIIPWFAAEPLGYFLGFAIQFYFALEIIKDNRRTKSSPSLRTRTPSSSVTSSFTESDVQRELSQENITGSKTEGKAKKKNRYYRREDNQPHQGGRLSYNYWLIPSFILFSWCEQTQFFQTLASNSFQPTSTLMGLPFVAFSDGNNSLSTWQDGSNLSTYLPTALSSLLPGNAIASSNGSSLFSQGIFSSPLPLATATAMPFARELQVLVYLLTYIGTRITFTWIGLSIFQKAIDWKNNNYLRPLNWIYSECFLPLATKTRKIAHLVLRVFARTTSSVPPLGVKAKEYSETVITDNKTKISTTGSQFGTLAPPKKVQHLLRDPLAIAAVTCSFAFLPSYSTNLLVTKSVGFFPEENRIKHSFFSPWDMPAEVLASDMDFISSHHNLAEYPFFLPFYDKGDYGGWLGVGEEDIRYGPFKLWQTRRIRAPWRRTTLQEPSLTYANDKSLFVNPNPNPRKEESTSITSRQQKTPFFSLSLPVVTSLSPKVNEGVTEGEGVKGGSPSSGTQVVNEKVKTNMSTGSSPFSLPFPFFASPEVTSMHSVTKGDGDPHSSPFGRPPSVTSQKKGINEPKDFSSAFLWRTPMAENSSLNSTITKGGRKRLIEGFKKPVRKMSTSKLFNLSSFPSPSPLVTPKVLRTENTPLTIVGTQEHKKQAFLTPSPKEYLPSPSFAVTKGDGNATEPKVKKGGTGGFVNTLKEISEKITKKFSNGGNLSSYPVAGSKGAIAYGEGEKILSEIQIKNTKQIRKRFKKFKKRVRLFRSKSYKKRNTKIRRLKHFHYLRNKKKKRRKSRRLIYKLRRQFPYMRNIKERKAEIFGLYSPVFSSLVTTKDSSPSIFIPSEYNKGETKETSPERKLVTTSENNINTTFGNEKSFYDRGYPKNKDSLNTKKDFNFIFRTQIGERLDFAQEEIRARIFMNPYIRFLLNRRIDNFLSREKILSSNETSVSYPQSQKTLEHEKAALTIKNKSLLSPSPKVNTFGDGVKTQLTKLTVDAEEKLFKRRLIISKYADAIDFLKPNSRHSYVDRIYNHQFKGTLSTARRLFSLKVQFDQPLVYAKNYEPVLEHEDQIQNSTPRKVTEGKKSPVPSSLLPKESDKTIENEVKTALLEKSSSAPFYAAWDESLRKLVFTNRYLDHKLATRGENKVEKNHHQQFTSWPLKEPYFKDNEFLVSQLYSNSQPIDSFLSQENEKARPATLPRRVNSFNTVLSYKNSVPPTEAQRSQQFFKIENNDRKTFLFKHLWTPSNTAVSDEKPKAVDSFEEKFAVTKGDGILQRSKDSVSIKENNFINKNKYKLPTSAEQRKTTRMEEREYPLWMVLRTLAPNQGGFLWPGD